ncbi:MAG: VCBS repeat-containing protein [Balneolaceae bacterium]|nr:VCBS repeat-containing protein [Balneolaceae bacterium]MBO6547325.1 VCBS repeat-containing protein [Balneolaceae bacterium]MBO6647728.1 VCBS repeat-containing protein [Balneolaceae bacterium]
MPKHHLLFCISILLSASCNIDTEPPIPSYDRVIVVEEEPRLSANGEIVDINGDGFNDVVLAIGRHWPGPNLLFVGDGAGGFSRVDSLSNPWDRTYSVSVADMDMDGDADFVVSNDRPDPKYVLLNDGNGNFTERIEFGDPNWPTRNSTVADLNQDGLPDIVVANRDNSPEGNNWVCLNETTEEFSLNCKSIVSGSATTISVADMNADGFQDLLIPYRDGGQSHVYVGDGTGNFVRGVSFGPNDASYRAAIAVDMNSDNLLDIVAINDRKRTATLFYQTENHLFEEGIRIDDGEMIPYALEVADLDANGKDDVIIGYREAPTRIFFNRADSLVEIAIGDSLGAAYGFGVGDFNHDGIMDIVSARSGASDLLFLGKTSYN